MWLKIMCWYAVVFSLYIYILIQTSNLSLIAYGSCPCVTHSECHVEGGLSHGYDYQHSCAQNG